MITGAYNRAVTALEEHGFVLLVGEPAAGKSTVASLLAMTSLDQWDTSIVKIDHPDQLVAHWNPEEPAQFFWIDDAFGVTQYEPHLVYAWNHIFAQVKAALRGGARVVMTSRDYIYNRARQDLKEAAFPLLQESKVVIDLGELTIDEKRQILYNHIKLGNQPKTFRAQAKPLLESVAGNTRFSPEIARRLSDKFFTKGLRLTAYDFQQFVEKREAFLRDGSCAHPKGLRIAT